MLFVRVCCFFSFFLLCFWSTVESFAQRGPVVTDLEKDKNLPKAFFIHIYGFITVSDDDDFFFFVVRMVLFLCAHTLCQLYKNIGLSYGWSVLVLLVGTCDAQLFSLLESSRVGATVW